jgi:hypothetical protein
MYPFHQQVQEFFPDFNYRNPSPEVRRRCNMTLGPENVVGHQQRAFSCYWALKQCGPMDLGLDLGSPKGMTPYCVHVDLFGSGAVHPFYGGGRYLSDVIWDASRMDIFPIDAVPLIVSNHSLEHMPAGDDAVCSILSQWIGRLRSGGILAMCIPDNAHFDVMASDKDHKHAWSHADFKGRVLDKVLAMGQVDLIEYDTLQNFFSFDVVLRKK